MPQQWIFDRDAYQELNEARLSFLQPAFADAKTFFQARTAADVGCGLGYFTDKLRNLGFTATGLEGRRENAEEAKHRFPQLDFQVVNIEDPRAAEVGTFDLVLCLGLLYHLENPLQAVRNLHALTGSLLILESQCTPEELPRMVLFEEAAVEDQGLRHVAFYPSEGCLVKMLYVSGFTHVWRFRSAPDHADFRQTRNRKRVRTFLFAARTAVPFPYLTPARDPGFPGDVWMTDWARTKHWAKRLLPFAK